MIYSTNRISSLGTGTVATNESYYGVGSLDYVQECAQDELAIFESAIKSDIDECIIGESSYELQALNEGFIENAYNKIKELMKKFKEWLKAVFRSAYAKLSNLLIRDNAKFAKSARKQLVKVRKDKFNYSGKVFDSADCSINDAIKELTDWAEGLAGYIKKATLNDDDLENAEELKKRADDFTVESYLEDNTENKTEITMKDVQNHLLILESLSKKTMKDIKATMKKIDKLADGVVKAADSDQRSLLAKTGDDKATDEQKKSASIKVKVANLFKTSSQTEISRLLSIAKTAAKIARRVVMAALSYSGFKNEAYEENLLIATMEAAEQEYDDALEDMSECDDDDCRDSDDDDDDED